MVLEVAHLEISTTDQPAFEAAFAEASQHISTVEGYIHHELHIGVEEPERYLLLVHWETLEAHTVTFRESPAYEHWRKLIHPYFAAKPIVTHYALTYSHSERDSE
ncbi:MAG: antibiotic biosynthesis monooxygenase [Chloroflexota bacterium]